MSHRKMNSHSYTYSRFYYKNLYKIDMRQGKLHELTFNIKLTISHEVILKYVITCISNQNIMIKMHVIVIQMKSVLSLQSV